MTPPDAPLAYLITFRCDATWFQGDERGSVTRKGPRGRGDPKLAPNAGLASFQEERTRGGAFVLGPPARDTVAVALEEVVAYRGWTLSAAHVGVNHVHAVIGADERPEIVMNQLKAYATRRLRAAGLAGQEQRIWSRHGSTVYLWRTEDLEGAVAYALEGQGPK